MEWISEKILKYLDFNGGVYIECGANDGISQSNTFKLEKEKNWLGLLIEPSVNTYNECVKNRSTKNTILNCALVSYDFNEDFIVGDFDGHLMSSVNGERRNNPNLNKVNVRKLSDILDEYRYKKIDFFSLDVEGYELEVLKGIDFTRHRPTYILIEVYTKDMDKIFSFMNTNSYEMIENLSNFNNIDYPHWDGTHNDYLFKTKI
jgi:FkbM family methyltransferase